MKRIFVYTFLLIIFSFSVNAQWEVKYDGTSRLHNLEFHNNIGFVGAGDHMLRSLDWGDTWEPLSFNLAGFQIRNFQIVDSAYIIATGKIDKMGYLIESLDTGNTWNVLDSLEAFKTSKFVLLEDKNTLIYSYEEILYQYSLSKKQSKEVFEFHSLGATISGVLEYEFISEKVGFLYVHLFGFQKPKDRILKTVDGGNNWESFELPPIDIYDVQFVNVDSVYLLGETNLFLLTYQDLKLDTIMKLQIPPNTDFNRKLISFSVLKNGTGFIGGGWQAGINLETDYCTIIKLNTRNNKFETVYDSIGLAILFTHVIDDSTWIAVTAGGVIIKTKTSGGQFPSDYPWKKVFVSNIDELLSPSQIQVTISPNPSNDVFDVLIDDNTHINEWRLYNNNGQLIKTKHINSRKRISIDLTNNDRGLYFLQLILDKNKTITRKIIKE